MEIISVPAQSKQYNVYLGEGILSNLPNFIDENLSDCTKIFILTDETVGKLHLAQLQDVLSSLSIEVIEYTVPSGENAKTFDVYQSCLTFALERKLDRKSLLLAFGGGAVGDLGGFVAATFMRGIPFIQIPTTILAHDSAVGGKVAINHKLGKNMVGAFYHPEAVFYDLNFLKTLPMSEIRSGFSEVIKHALISDQTFLNYLMENVHNLQAIKSETLIYFLKKGIETKSKIVSEDERELGIRAFLNFGHTLAHAIEAELGYGKTTHGEAVLIGMLFALDMSVEQYNLQFELTEFMKWLKELGYKIQLPTNLSVDKLVNAMFHDKKTIGNNLRFVLLREVGKPVIATVDDNYIYKKLQQFS